MPPAARFDILIGLVTNQQEPANHIGKKRPDGVFVMPDDPTPVLKELPVGEVWGIGRQMVQRLKAERVFTALQFRDLPDDMIRRAGSVVTLRTAMELRGIPAVDERNYETDPDSVSCSRSFGEPVTSEEALSESVATFTAQAATKLRKHGLTAAGCNIYAQMGTACEHSYVARTVTFPLPTDATNDMLRAIREEVDALYIEGTRYRKTGIGFFGLEKPGTVHQTDLFDNTPPAEKSRLYAAVDALNARYGKGKVFSAAQGLGTRSWHMKRQKLSARPTTRWDELMTVR